MVISNRFEQPEQQRCSEVIGILIRDPGNDRRTDGHARSDEKLDAVPAGVGAQKNTAAGSWPATMNLRGAIQRV